MRSLPRAVPIGSIFLLSATAGWSFRPPAAPPKLSPVAASEQILATRNDAVNRITVPVSIDGKGPYHFVVDTGADRTVISRELAGALALKPGGPVTMLSMGGVDQVPTAIVPGLQLSADRMEDIRAPMLAESDLSAQGLLGIDSLAAKRVVMDFRARQMTIVDADQPEVRATDEIVVRARRRFGQLILVDADVDGESVAVIIDTGSQTTIGNAALRSRLSRSNAIGSLQRINLISVMGREIPAVYTQVQHVRVGGITVNNMPIAFADAKPFHALGLTGRPALLLGMDVLRTFDRVSVDFANKRVRFLLPTPGAKLPGTRLAAL
ncbi:retropepsin-like aspartic protease [Flavisphingomonas formosensis]|uniref:retropepsin-like aspartic protease n=1 Tax=Flavisphingomonas formosensis TaxID=861534 RepID=UPI0012FA8E2B|nr:retropepsin-like aspartic protease [Sphingomonas formosensis]